MLRATALLSSLLMLTLPACSPVGFLNSTAPRSGVAIHQNIAYAPGPRHRLDVYAPEGVKGAPVVVFFYGGGWTEGSKEQYEFVGAALARRGIVTVIPDYRIYPQARFPDFIEDGAQAVRWARDHASVYGGDPHRLFLVGHSAGGYIAAMLTLAPKWLARDGVDSHRDIAGFVGLSGPYDFLPLRDPVLDKIFAPAGDLALSQPINFVDGKAAPMLLLSGDGDTIVYPANSQHLAAKVRAAGGKADIILYRGVPHTLMIGAFAWPLRFTAPSLKDTVSFINATGAAR